ncbi:cytochrome c biogenesis protein ResB [Brevibacterium sp. BRM-1]|uniref:cytochrome c biogenesis protein ResB n=1 Tax=Brevibacterium sp. BRM-1 TaxID=2999062 RepID=UPI002281FB32|nr:cytochrome c biogenesis protein ResB [Brevibacterium sp. BRM-1]WAL41571.1 cytochrome c biogenesis protein ResB [Brevibacterium sp. BRM-1]
MAEHDHAGRPAHDDAGGPVPSRERPAAGEQRPTTQEEQPEQVAKRRNGAAAGSEAAEGPATSGSAKAGSQAKAGSRAQPGRTKARAATPGGTKAGQEPEAATTGSGRGPSAGKAGRPAGASGPAAPANLGVLGMARWAWRQLTTMRAALILLLILALAAIPGSLLPQRIQDPGRVTTYIQDNGQLGQVLDRLQLFDVYSSFWFSAVYILLMISLVGCVVPRSAQHWKAMRAKPPKAPRRLGRMPGYQEFALPEGQAPQALLLQAQKRLKRAGYRTALAEDHVAAERGYLRETGNLVFHISLLALVITMAAGSLFGYSGQRVLVEGDTFTNSLVSYDSFEPGSYYDSDRMPDFRLKLDSFDATFDTQAQGSQFGQPRSFLAKVTETSNGASTQHELRVNEPIRINGTRVYLTGNGYAPVVTTRNAKGQVTFSGPVVFLPEDGNYTSRGVIKVPDAGKEQLGFGAVLLPTAGLNKDNELISTFAGLERPYLVMTAYKGNLGLDSGQAQSVYDLDTSEMEPIAGADGQPLRLEMSPGKTAQLPDGLGSITLDRIDKYVSLDVRHDPTQGFMLVFSVLLVAGLGLSLFVPRRRMWVRVKDGRVKVAALARGEDPRVQAAAADLAVDLRD